MNSRGISVIYGALLILMILSVFYAYVNASVVPKICENAESGFVDTLISKSLELVSKSWNVINSGKPSSIYIPLGGHYPIIPFFVTPSTYSATLITYKSEFTLSGVTYLDAKNSMQDNPTDKIELKGICNLELRPNTGFIKNYAIKIEYGVVVICVGDKCYPLRGKILDGDGNIYLQFYKSKETFSVSDVNGLYLKLYPYSGGIASLPVELKNAELILKTSLPKRFWQDYIYDLFNRSFVISWSFSNGELIVRLKNGNYVLHAGVVSFGDVGRLNASYLIRVSPPSGREPADVYVMAKDVLGNPVPYCKVTFKPDKTEVCFDSSTCYATDKTVYTNGNGIVGAVAKVTSPNPYGIVVVRLDRPPQAPYDVYFTVWSS